MGYESCINPWHVAFFFPLRALATKMPHSDGALRLPSLHLVPQIQIASVEENGRKKSVLYVLLRCLSTTALQVNFAGLSALNRHRSLQTMANKQTTKQTHKRPNLFDINVTKHLAQISSLSNTNGREMRAYDVKSKIF